jgi:hypothetical protein
MRLVATGPTLVSPTVDTDPGTAGSPFSYQAGGAIQARSAGYFKNPEDGATVPTAGKLLKIVTNGLYPAGDGSALTNIPGTGNKKFAIFNLDTLGASFSTGALGFTPGLAVVIGGHGDNGSFSVGMHSSTVALVEQVRWSFAAFVGEAAVANEILFLKADPVGADTTTWRISAFGAGGITITQTAGNDAISSANSVALLLVYEA